VLNLRLGYLDARRASIRIGKIGDPPAHPEAAPDVVQPQLSIERSRAFGKPQSAH